MVVPPPHCGPGRSHRSPKKTPKGGQTPWGVGQRAGNRTTAAAGKHMGLLKLGMACQHCDRRSYLSTDVRSSALGPQPPTATGSPWYTVAAHRTRAGQPTQAGQPTRSLLHPSKCNKTELTDTMLSSH